jgi:hypothetical protein
MTRALPFTEASIARRAKGVRKAGLHVVAIKPDGTMILAEKPIDATSLGPAEPQVSPSHKSSWDDV